MKTYFRIRILGIPDGLEALISQHCFSAGASGLSEALQFIQPDITYDPKVLDKTAHNVDVFFSEKPSSDFFDQLKDLHSHLSFEIFEETEKDWLAEWKKDFRPFSLVDNYWVVPSWLETPAEAQHVIHVDPGMAFGTGTHATTQMASYFIHKACQNMNNSSLIDVGTGTAILAILAELHGIQRIVGIDIDPEARRVARQNILQNNMKHIEILDSDVDKIQESFDYVVANIIDGVLLQLGPHLLRLLKPDGQLFVTGILLERESIFLEKFIHANPLSVKRRIEKDEWVGYWLTHA